MNGNHLASDLSCTEILATLYAGVIRYDPANPKWPNRDRFVMSPGHKAGALYACLAECGFFPVAELEGFGTPGRLLEWTHVSDGVPGIEAATGSLGHGLGIAVGMALALRQAGNPARVYCLLSDGDMQEGSTYEAMRLAAHVRLGNLVAIWDRNGMTALGMMVPCSETPAPGWWHAEGADGHSTRALRRLLRGAVASRYPALIEAITVKGKGIPELEAMDWRSHYTKASELAP
jgi:transketolase